MKNFLILIAILLASVNCKENLKGKLDSYLDSLVNQNMFSGSILIAKGNDIFICKGYGMANFEHQVPNTPYMKFRIGSVTKQFTAIAIMILKEQGLLSTQDKISKYIADCPDTWKEITIHHLLTHSSGIPNYTSFPNHNDIRKKDLNISQVMDLFRDKQLNFNPGKKYSYSNSGYIILGSIIETVSQMQYEEFLKKKIFEPLSMKNTGYDYNEELLSNRTSGYYRYGNTIKNGKYTNMSIPHAAGALYSTVEDLYIWDRALYTDTLLSKKSFDTIFTKHIANYGYGWEIYEFKPNFKKIGHFGGISGFSSCIVRYISDDIVLIFLSNITTNIRAIVQFIEREIITELYLK